MPARDGDIALNLLLYAGVCVGFPVSVWLALIAPRRVAAVYRRLTHPGPRPLSPPIERLAADLRRIHRAQLRLPAGASMVKRRGTQRAYDEVLGKACVALDIRNELALLPDGFERDVERARVEVTLQRSGLMID